MPNLTCQVCGASYYRQPCLVAKSKYCSRACYHQAQANPDAPKHHPLYNTWIQMQHRCKNPKSISFPHYGALGITVCERWQNDFWAFAKDMGDRPEGMTLDRIKGDGNYEPSNCRWADEETQNNNRRNNHFLTWQERTQTISQWARETGLNKKTLYRRIKAGWPIERALSTPANPRLARHGLRTVASDLQGRN